MTAKFEQAMQHKPFKRARNRMYRSAMGKGEDLSLFDVFEIIRDDGYFKHIKSVQVCLTLAIDIYTSCSFTLPDEYATALKNLQNGDGTRFVKLAMEQF